MLGTMNFCQIREIVINNNHGKDYQWATITLIDKDGETLEIGVFHPDSKDTVPLLITHGVYDK